MFYKFYVTKFKTVSKMYKQIKLKCLFMFNQQQPLQQQQQQQPPTSISFDINLFAPLQYNFLNSIKLKK